MKAVRLCAGLAITLGAVTALVGFQDGRGELSGVVRDDSGAEVPGVTVVVMAAGQRQPLSEVTQIHGAYLFPILPAGRYTVSCQLSAFLEFTREDVVVEAGKHVELNVTLARGVPTSELTNRIGPPGVQTPTIPVRLETAFGDIDIAVDTVHAPITATNFLKYIDGGFYNGGRFHRTTRPDTYNPVLPNRPPMAIVQGGINPAAHPGIPPIPLERTNVTGITHVIGVVSMARGAPDTATSDFFIMLDNQPSLDFGGKRFDDEQGAAAFGRVIAGLEVVRKIQQQPVSERQPTADNPLTHTQNLTPPVPIAKGCRFARMSGDDGVPLVRGTPGCSGVK
jgi:peptidyl-prolyl cis-trans isomerase A (cyclophilin A)